MEISYKPLWKLLIDRDVTKRELRLRAGISTRALAKLEKNGDVSTDDLRKSVLLHNATWPIFMETRSASSK